MNDKLKIESKIIELVLKIRNTDIFGENISEQITSETNLIEELEFSSFDIITLIVLLEEEFQIIISDDDLVIDNFQDISAITNYINEVKM